MKKASKLLAILCIILALVSCKGHPNPHKYTYDFPEYNEFISTMKENYPRFKIKIIDTMGRSDYRKIEIKGKIPQEDVFDVFYNLIDVILKGEGYMKFSESPYELDSQMSRVTVKIITKDGEFSFQSEYDNKRGEMLITDENYNGFYSWTMTPPEDLKTKEDASRTLEYEDGKWSDDYYEHFGIDISDED